MDINSNWSFKELVLNLKMLKREYSFRLAFFSYSNSYYDLVEENKYKREIRNKFYSLNFREDLIDRCWEYMNGYYPYYPLMRRIQRIDKNKIK